MAHIGNILRDKLFVFSGSTKTTPAENDILSLIFEKENLGQIIRASLIDNGENYDSYRVRTTEAEFLIKLSLDPDLQCFAHEFQILQKIEELNIAPKPVACGELDYGDKILYLITNFEAAQSCEEIGKSILLFNYEDALNRLFQAHNIQLNSPTLQDSLRTFFAATNFAEIPDFKDLAEKNSLNYQLLTSEIAEAKQFIQDSYKESFSADTLCHSNINASTLLFGQFDIKIINWQKSFAANPLIDLSNLRMSFEYDEDFEYKIFNSYNSLAGNKYSWDEYLATRNFWAAIKLLDDTYSYIKEIYLFRSLRQNKILSRFSSFCRNIKFYEHIPAFKKNKEELINLFSKPML